MHNTAALPCAKIQLHKRKQFLSKYSETVGLLQKISTGSPWNFEKEPDPKLAGKTSILWLRFFMPLIHYMLRNSTAFWLATYLKLMPETIFSKPKINTYKYINIPYSSIVTHDFPHHALHCRDTNYDCSLKDIFSQTSVAAKIDKIKRWYAETMSNV